MTIRQGLRLIHSRIAGAASGITPPVSPRPNSAEGGAHTEEDVGPPSFSIVRNDKNVLFTEFGVDGRLYLIRSYFRTPP